MVTVTVTFNSDMIILGGGRVTPKPAYARGSERFYDSCEQGASEHWPHREIPLTPVSDGEVWPELTGKGGFGRSCSTALVSPGQHHPR